MTKELTEEALMAEMEADITVGFNKLAELVVDDLSTNVREGGVSATLTGFYASSWKADKTPIQYNDRVQAHQPWADKRDAYDATRKRPTPTIDKRHTIPKFNINDTMYIANTAEYTSAAFSYSAVVEYAQYQVNKRIEQAFSDRSIISYKANI